MSKIGSVLRRHPRLTGRVAVLAILLALAVGNVAASGDVSGIGDIVDQGATTISGP